VIGCIISYYIVFNFHLIIYTPIHPPLGVISRPSTTIHHRHIHAQS